MDEETLNHVINELTDDVVLINRRLDILQKTLDSISEKISNLEVGVANNIKVIETNATILDNERKRQRKLEVLIASAIAEDNKPLPQRISEFAERIMKRNSNRSK